jgi:predicted nucleic acid-binding protein
MIGSSILLDSSVWLGFLKGENEKAREFVGSNSTTLTSSISIYEICRKLLKIGYGKREVEKNLAFIRSSSFIVEVSDKISKNAAYDSIKYGLHAMDALIYQSAIENDATLVTLDNDFRGLPGARIIDLD